MDRQRKDEAILIVDDNEINRMILSETFRDQDKILEADGTAIYLKAYREAEKEAAYHLVRLLRSPGNTYNIERELEAVLAKSKMTLAQKQEEAVRNGISVPGIHHHWRPGKGKTTILKIILQNIERLEKNKSVLLCAPTAEPGKDFQRALVSGFYNPQSIICNG